MKAYWEGKKELFSGLAIEELEKGNKDAWKRYPVFYFDFNGANYQQTGALEDVLNAQLRRWEKQYGKDDYDAILGERFQNLLIRAREQTGLRCVVLVDEYDKPLMDVTENPQLQEHNEEVFKGFFSTLKSSDEYVHFIFITGVSKFHKVSIFSDLNQLTDISISKKYAEICGITEEELKKYFPSEIKELAKEQGLTEHECMAQLRKTYDGYHFHQKSVGVYNPFSLLNAFFNCEFGSYWFETGTPSFLVKKLKESRFDVKRISDHTIFASESVLKDYTGDNMDPVPVLYQTGYLTIAGYDSKKNRYTLSFPNEEVKYGFLESLLPSYVHTFAGRIDCIVSTTKFIYLFEFKRDDIAEAALAQIDSKEYALPFMADPRRLYKIGVAFDSCTRKLVSWKAVEIKK